MVKFTVLNLWKNWGNLIFKCGKKTTKKEKNVDFFRKKLATLSRQALCVNIVHKPCPAILVSCPLNL